MEEHRLYEMTPELYREIYCEMNSDDFFSVLKLTCEICDNDFAYKLTDEERENRTKYVCYGPLMLGKDVNDLFPDVPDDIRGALDKDGDKFIICPTCRRKRRKEIQEYYSHSGIQLD